MKKKKILAILALSVILSSSSLMGTSKAFAASTGNPTNQVLSLGIENGKIPNLQAIMGYSSNYYYNGFPAKIEIQTKQFNSNNVVLDYVQPVADRDYSVYNLKFLGNDGSKAAFDHLKVKRYITVEDKVVETYAEAMAAAKRKGVIKKGEKILSIILQRDSPYIDDIKVERNTFFDCLGTRVLASNTNSGITTSKTYGATNQQAYSIAKTVGMEFTAGLGFSKGPLSGNVGYKLQSSLTKTFSNSYTITDSTTETYTHDFGKSSIDRRGAIYQYVEKYKSIPTINKNYSLPSYFKGYLIPAEDTNYRTNRLQSVSITNGQFFNPKGILNINSSVELNNVYGYENKALKFLNNGEALFDLGTTDETKVYDVKIEYENTGNTNAVLALSRRAVYLRNLNLDQKYIDVLNPWVTNNNVNLSPTNGQVKTVTVNSFRVDEIKGAHNYFRTLLKMPSNGDLIIHKIILTKR